VPAGHTLIGSLNLNSLASLPVLTVSDSKGNTYQVDGSLDDATTNTTYLFSARITNALSVGDVITLGLPTSPTVNTRFRWAWDIEEFDNIVASSWLDQTSSNAASSINPTTGTSPSTTQSNELVFAAFGYGSRTFTPSTGSLFTVSPQQKTTAGSSDRSLSNEWKFVTATGTQVATGKFSAPASAAAYVGLLATYKTTGALSAVTGTLSLADGAGFAGTFVAPLLSDNRTYLLPDESGMLCLQGSANCGFILTNSDAITIGTPTNPTVVQKAAQTTTNTAGADLTVQGATGNGTGTGGTVTIKGGTGGATNANGGTLVLSGGDAGGTGKMGLVSLSPTVFASSAVQTLGTTQTLNQAWIDSYSTLPLVASAPSLTFTVPAPSINTVGRVFYLSNAGVSGTGNDFSISLAGTGISINLKPNSTATLIWNGNGWTAAGASSATDLQAAYNNTQTSAGGAEIVLNPIGGAADGLTIRNNGTTPIVGGLFEVQSNIGTNLFSVNNQGAELAANGGAETITNFGTNWTALGGTTITQSSTTYATGKYSVDVTQPAGGAANRGVINNLSANPAVSTTYTVSFTAKVSSGTPTLNVYYSYNGGGAQTPCTMYGSYQTANTTQWSKVTCRITTPANAVTNPDLVIYTSDAIGATRELYIDNLSFVQNDANTIPSNVQMGGGVNGGQVTLFTLDRSSVPPLVANGDSRYLGSMYYDTTLGNIQCYELDGWGACGSAPDNIITLTPEYTGAVLNGTGVGTMTADFCGNGGGLTVNTGFCASGEARNYYRWTSPQATDQAYSIYVSYKLPSTFKEFVAGTTSLTSLVDNTSNASVKYAIFKKNSAGGLVSCSADATMTGTVSTWNSTVPTVDLGTGACHTGGATPFAAGDTVVIRITVSAKSNANAYVENLTFRYSNK
jgi:hypothetical protein